MVQEVQTSVSIPQENTLETIQAIGTSSVKIIEWRQTRGWHYISAASVSGSWPWYYDSWWSRQSPMIQWSMSAGSATGKMIFNVSWNKIRIPIAWTYQLTLYWSGWSSTYSPTVYMIKWASENDEVLYTKTFPNSSSETINLTFDLGKFDVITIWFSYYYSWSSSWATLGADYSLTITQL